MPSPTPDHQSDTTPPLPPGGAVTLAESLAYSRQMLENLQRMHARQGHRLLAQLLGLAANEADSLLKGEG
jgi:hypothetical protein